MFLEPQDFERLDKALSDQRYTRLCITPDVQCLIRDIYSAGAAFFGLAEDIKLKQRSTENSGYRPYGVERSRTSAYFDHIESFSVSRRASSSREPVSFAVAETLSKLMLKLFDIYEPFVEDLVTRFAQKIDPAIKPDRFKGALRDWSYLQLNHRVSIPSSKTFISDLHEDACILTILSNNGPGLEIENSVGDMIPVSIAEQELICFSGEILSLLSGGMFHPAYHRVRALPDQMERMAIALFADLDPKACQPWVVTNSNRGVDIGDFVRRSPTLHGLEPWS